MNIEEFGVATKEELIEYGKTIPLYGVFDSNGNRLNYRSITGKWYELTYDSNDNELTYKNSEGYDFELLCIGKEFNLMYDECKQLYKAGCEKLNYNECIELFDKEATYYSDAKLFMDAIHQNELDTLK